MNVIRRYTIKNLLKNKRRTILTIIGLILGISLISGVATFVSSLLNTIRIDEELNSGSQNGRIYSHEAVDTASDEYLEWTLFKEYKSYDPTYFHEGGDYYENRGVMTFAISTEGWNHLSDRVLEGRLPKDEGEFVIPKWLYEYENFKIGQNYAFKENHVLDENGQKAFRDNPENAEIVDTGETVTRTLVGVVKLPYEGIYPYAVIYTTDDTPDTPEGIYDLRLKDVNASGVNHLRATYPDIELNMVLLQYYFVNTGDFASSFFSFLTAAMVTMLVLVSLPIIAVFANAFGISLAERTRALGMLSSIGATKKQLRRSVFFEAFIIGIIAIPLGVLGGILGIYVTLHFISDLVLGTFTETGLHLHLEPYWIILGTLASCIMLFVSAYIPAKRVSHITPIDAIRNNKDVKLTNKQVKTSKLTRKIFGKEGELALKNLKRNNKQYRFTVISLILSLVMFLGTMTFSHYLKDSMKVVDENKDYNVSLSIFSSTNSGNAQEGDENFKEFLDKVSEKREALGVPSDAFIDLYDFSIVDKENESDLMVSFKGVDDEVFKEVQEKIGTSGSYEDEGIQAIVFDLVEYSNDEVFKNKMHLYTDRSPRNMLIQELSWINTDGPMQEPTYETIGEASVLGFSDEGFSSINPEGYEDAYAIVAFSDLEELFSKRTESYEGVPMMGLYFNAQDASGLVEEIHSLFSNDDTFGYSYNVWNESEYREQEANFMRFLTILLYGLITLLVLTALSNVINTLSTSYALRMKEFAMLKSVGMGNKSFNRMVNFEVIFYLIKTMLYGLPLAGLFIFILYKEMGHIMDSPFYVPVIPLLAALAVLLVILLLVTRWARKRIKEANIIETLRSELT